VPTPKAITDFLNKKYNTTEVESEPITRELLEGMGFVHKWPDWLDSPEYRRPSEHPEGKAYVSHPGGFKGVMNAGENKNLHTKQDLIDYLNNPDRHKG